jgi:hypothetical protein
MSTYLLTTRAPACSISVSLSCYLCMSVCKQLAGCCDAARQQRVNSLPAMHQQAPALPAARPAWSTMPPVAALPLLLLHEQAVCAAAGAGVSPALGLAHCCLPLYCQANHVQLPAAARAGTAPQPEQHSVMLLLLLLLAVAHCWRGSTQCCSG